MQSLGDVDIEKFGRNPMTGKSSFMSNLPEVSGLTIAIVAAGCAMLILCLLLVLIFFCCRNIRRAKGKAGGGGGSGGASGSGSSEDSERCSHQDGLSASERKSAYIQHQALPHERHHLQHLQHGYNASIKQQQQLVMVSPHPSLTSTDETSVDQASGRVFATLISANNPLGSAGMHNNNEGSDSDHSGGSLLLQSSLQRTQQQQQRKIIYEVVV